MSFALLIQRNPWRLNTAVFLSLLAHALLLSITLGGQRFGLPSLNFPWKERRLGAQDLQVLLAPAKPVPNTPLTLPTDAEPIMSDIPDAAPAAVAIAPPPPAALMAAVSRPEVNLPIAPNAPPVRAASNADTPGAPAQGKEAAQSGSVLEAEQSQAELAAEAQREVARQDQVRLDAARAEQAARNELARKTVEQQESARAQAVREEAASLDVARQEAQQAESARIEAVRQEQARQAEREAAQQAQQAIALQEAARQEALKQAAAQQEAARQEAAKSEAARQEAARQQIAANDNAVRQAAARQEAERQAAARQEAARQETARQEAMRQEAARQELARQEIARREAAKYDAARQEAARQEAAQQDAARKDAARQEALRQEAARQDAMNQEVARQERARQEQAQRERADEEAKREERLRAIGKQLNDEAAKREASTDPARNALPTVSSLRRGWLFGRADPNGDLVLYAEAMARKIELNMTFDIVRDAVKQPHTQPVVTVALRADGSVEKVTFVVSSGVPAIDEAIRQVIASQAPYAKFPPALARRYDVVEIRRTWLFDTAIRLQ